MSKVSKVRGALGVQEMSKVKRFFDKIISTYINFNVYLGTFDDCNLEVITNQVSTRVKLAKWFLPGIHRADFASINVDASKWPKNDFSGCGVLLRGANGMPLICQISRHPFANALQAEVEANLEGFKIAARSRFNLVFLYTDAGHAIDLVVSNKANERIWPEYGKNVDVQMDIKLCRGFLSKYLCWKQFFIHRGLNIPADSLASLGSYLIKNGWPDDMEKEYVNDSGLKVVIKISRERIYLENCVPLGFKEVLTNDNGSWPYDLKFSPKVQDEKLEVATAKESSMFSLWLNDLVHLTYRELNLKCVFFQVWKTCVLVGEMQVNVYYRKILEKWELSDAEANAILEKLLFNLDAFNKIVFPLQISQEELTLRTVVQLFNYSPEERSKLLPKAKVELPAKCIELGSCDFSDGVFEVSVITIYDDKLEKMKHKKFQEDLKEIDEIDLGSWLEKNKDDDMAIMIGEHSKKEE